MWNFVDKQTLLKNMINTTHTNIETLFNRLLISQFLKKKKTNLAEIVKNN